MANIYEHNIVFLSILEQLKDLNEQIGMLKNTDKSFNQFMLSELDKEKAGLIFEMKEELVKRNLLGVMKEAVMTY